MTSAPFAVAAAILVAIVVPSSPATGQVSTGQVASGQVPLAGQIAYASGPAPGGGRRWVSLGWPVRLVRDPDGGWSCTISGGPMVELAPGGSHAAGYQRYTYGAGFIVNRRGTQMFAWHDGPAAPQNPRTLNVWVRRGQRHFPIGQRYVNGGRLVMIADVPGDVFAQDILPDLLDNDVLHLNIDQTAYGLGAMNMRLTLPQFAECRQWMERYNGGP